MADNAQSTPDAPVAHGARAASGRVLIKRGMKRALKTLFLVALIVILVAVAASYVLDYRGQKRLEAAEARAQAMGVPLGFDDEFFAEWDVTSKVSAGEEAAVYYEAAFSLARVEPGKEEQRNLPVCGTADEPADPRAALEPGIIAAMRSCVDERKELFALLHMGSLIPKCHYTVEYEGYDTPMPFLARARQCARLLAMKTWLEAEQGRSHDGVQTSLDGVALGRTCFGEPWLISALVGRNIYDIVLDDGVRRLLSKTDPSQEDLELLQRAVLSAGREMSLRTAFVGEIACQRKFYEGLLNGEEISDVTAAVAGLDQVAAGPQSTWDAVADWVREAFNLSGENSLFISVVREHARPAAERSSSARLWVWLLRGYYKLDMACALDTTLILVGRATNAELRELTTVGLEQFGRTTYYRPYVVAPLLCQAFSTCLQQCEQTRAKLLSAGVCVAAMRFRSDKGDWPDTLEAMVPEYLDSVPADPFTGGPLVYRTDKEGIMAYSVGPNATDDGGKPHLAFDPEALSQSGYSGDDAGFEILK